MAYGLLASAYFRTDRFPEAESTLQRASERKLETPTILVIRYNIAVLKGDQEEMDRVVSQAKGKRRAEHWMAHQEALALARSGRLQAARRSSEPRRGAGPARADWTRSPQRVTWPHELCGRPFAGMPPKE